MHVGYACVWHVNATCTRQSCYAQRSLCGEHVLMAHLNEYRRAHQSADQALHASFGKLRVSSKFYLKLHRSGRVGGSVGERDNLGVGGTKRALEKNNGSECCRRYCDRCWCLQICLEQQVWRAERIKGTADNPLHCTALQKRGNLQIVGGGQFASSSLPVTTSCIHIAIAV